jgi:hypothetical protein
MKFALIPAVLVALTLTACGKPDQALPEQEKNKYKDIITKPAEPAAAPAEEPAAAAPAAGDDMSGDAVLPAGPALDGNGNPLPPGQSAIPEGH